MARLKPSQFKDKSAQQSVRSFKSLTVIDGQPIEKSTSSKLHVLKAGEKSLQRKGFAQSIPGRSTDAEYCACNILQSIGCSISAEGANYSLLQTETDQEGLDNPDILDQKDFDKIKNEYVTLDEKFDDDDPIFQLDDTIPILKKQQIEAIKSTTTPSVAVIASSVVSYGFSKSKKTTKYFKQ
tara:strand:- start:111 stop:656 length:546 start_codon:yes stop_codon:yes gene_type:complete